MALSFQDTEAGTSYGMPAFKVSGKTFLVYREDLSALVVRATMEERDEMIADDPETYFTTDHHRKYPWVLVRLSRARPEALRDLLWRACESARPRPRKPRAPGLTVC